MAGSSAAASRSSSHSVRSAPETPAAGTCTGPAPSKAIFAAAALSVPLTTNQTSCDRLITGKVRLIRSGGGFGEARTANHLSLGVGRGMLGEDRGDVTVRPHPEQADVEGLVPELAA